MSKSGPGVGTIRIVGIGMGPQHVTPEAAAALAASDYVIATRHASATTRPTTRPRSPPGTRPG